ncbi:MAG: hypothetical protein LUG64_06990, partial [Clostridiales bacterium]|nr:hypothetical protein [Clostridiales bacterium]
HFILPQSGKTPAEGFYNFYATSFLKSGFFDNLANRRTFPPGGFSCEKREKKREKCRKRCPVRFLQG